MPPTDPEIRMLLKRQAEQFADLRLILENGFTSLIDETKVVGKEVAALKADLVGPATGRDQVPLETHRAIVRDVSVVFGVALAFVTGLKLFGIG